MLELILFSGVGGLLMGIVMLFLILPLFRSIFENNPNEPERPAIFTEVLPEREKLVMRGGRPVRSLIGGDNGAPARHNPRTNHDDFLPWFWYRQYVYNAFGLHCTGFPPFQEVYRYRLPRRKFQRVDNVITLPEVEDWSDHVRYGHTTWYFQLDGCEVEGVPFAVQGSVVFNIIEGEIEKALFKTDAWNVALDQAIATLRGVIRAELHLDRLIGRVFESIWEIQQQDDQHREVYGMIERRFHEVLTTYQMERGDIQSTLKNRVAVKVTQVNIIDFIPQVTDEQKAELMAPALARQAARGRALAGAGEARYQEQVLAAAEKFRDLARENVWAEAIVKASKGGALDALLAALLKKMKE